MAGSKCKKAKPAMQDAHGGTDAPPEPVGGATEPPRTKAYVHAEKFCRSWDSVTPCDIVTILSIAVAACRIAAIIVPLFLGAGAGRAMQFRRIKRACHQHFPRRSRKFTDQLALELHEYVGGLADNGMSREEVSELIDELQSDAA